MAGQDAAGTRSDGSNDPTCEFCAIIHGADTSARVLFRTQDVVAFFPLDPATRGHTLVVPTRHVPDIRALRTNEARTLGEATTRTAHSIWASLRPDGMNVIQSNGTAATQTVEHLHVHLVPRYAGDRMQLAWPDGPAESLADQDKTLNLLRAGLPSPPPEGSPEDRRQHLSFIQAVITRMSQASSSAKTWLLPIVTAAYGYALAKDAPAAAVLGALAVLVFGLLDANYLKQERAFRGLYDEVARGSSIPSFAMNPALAGATGSRKNYWPDRQDIWSWSIAPVYGPMFCAGLAVALWLHCNT